MPSLAHPRLLALSVLLLVGLDLGCGHCDGAVRDLEIRSVDGCGLDACVEASGVYAVSGDATFRIVADGPSDDDDALRGDSGVDASTFFLVDADGALVPGTVSGDAGGHTCRSGVNFHLSPDAPLAPGTYTLVVDLEGIAWPLVGGLATQSHDGREALVRTIEVP